MNALILLFYRMAAFFTRVPKETRSENAEKMREILKDFPLKIDEFINNQNDLINMPFGRGSLVANGCGPVALYNAFHAVNDNISFFDIVRELEKSGAALFGKFGTSPASIRLILKKKGYNTEVCRYKNPNKINDFSNKFDAFISIIYNDSRDIRKGLHFICTYKNDDGSFTTHNPNQNGNTLYDVLSLCSTNKIRHVQTIGIKKKEINLINTDGIIFDIDGTIWNTTYVVERAWNKALDECGLSYAHVTAKQLQGLFGLPMMDIIDAIIPNETTEKKLEFKPLCYKYEDEFISRESGELYDKMVETIKRLSEKYPLYVVSNCQGGYIELMLEKTGMKPYFKDFTCPAYTDKLKADNILIIAERNGLKNPIYIGDTQMDANACKAANVPFVFAEYGFGTCDNPDYTIKKIEDILELVNA